MAKKKKIVTASVSSLQQKLSSLLEYYQNGRLSDAEKFAQLSLKFAVSSLKDTVSSITIK